MYSSNDLEKKKQIQSIFVLHGIRALSSVNPFLHIFFHFVQNHVWCKWWSHIQVKHCAATMCISSYYPWQSFPSDHISQTKQTELLAVVSIHKNVYLNQGKIWLSHWSNTTTRKRRWGNISNMRGWKLK